MIQTQNLAVVHVNFRWYVLATWFTNKK